MSVTHVDFGRSQEAVLTKRQLAAHPVIGYSRRWVELRTREGMPSEMAYGKRVFRLSEVLSWLAEHRPEAISEMPQTVSRPKRAIKPKKPASPPPSPPSPKPAAGGPDLEKAVAALKEAIAALEGPPSAA
jgi:hypothetical protein